MSDAGNALDVQLAQRLSSLRTARGLSLVQLATLSGVSKAMISRVERAESSPTATILGRLAAGLGVTLTELLVAPAVDARRLRRQAEQPLWRDSQLGYTRRQIAPPDQASGTEMIEVDMPAYVRVQYPSWSGKPYRQRLWLIEGALALSYGDEAFELAQGDSIDISVDRPLTFQAGASGCRYLLLILNAP